MECWSRRLFQLIFFSRIHITVRADDSSQEGGGKARIIVVSKGREEVKRANFAAWCHMIYEFSLKGLFFYNYFDSVGSINWSGFFFTAGFF